MKRLFCILAIAFISIYASSEPIGKKTAFEIAHNFFSGNPTTITGSVELVEVKYEQCLQTKSGDISDIPFFIFNNENGGFVIVSNHTSAAPILAYSFENKFEADNMPEGVRAWLEGQSELILRQKDNDPETGIRQKWNDLIYPTKATQTVPKHVKLETAQWSQRFPYNSLCPTINGQDTPTGCMATALAIVMRYWQWPKAGTGYIPEYYYNPIKGWGYGQNKPEGVETVKGGGYQLGYPYIWEEMPLYPDSEIEYSWAQREAIATLMKDCGALLEMVYTPNGSGATLEKASNLQIHMYYDTSADFIAASYFSWDEWISILESEISKNRPVLMAGRDKIEKHAFVADGFDENHYFHYNWGWGGAYNGFFSMEPPYENQSRVPGYFFAQQAWIRLQPNQNNPPRFNISWGDSSSYLSIEEGYYNINQAFTLNNISIQTADSSLPYSKDEFIGEIKAAVYDTNGHLKEYISEPIPLFHSNVNEPILECIITQSIDVGDYITLVFKCADGEDWQPINYVKELGNAIFYLKESECLADRTSLQLFPKIETQLVGDFLYIDTKLLIIETMIGTSIRLIDNSGTEWPEAEYIDGKWHYYYLLDTPKTDMDKTKYSIILSLLPSGTYTIILDHSLQHKEIKFTI